MSKSKKKVTPLMKQYFQIKGKYPDALLLFRVGDFYETFGEDAITVAQILNIVLTSRNNGGSDIELAGFPHHSLDVYLPKLVKAGYRVAICEQLEKPSKEKKIVKRGVTEIVTPGITTDQNLLDHKKNNYLCSVTVKDGIVGSSFLDLSTGEFLVHEGTESAFLKLVEAYSPSELIYNKADSDWKEKLLGDRYYSYGLEEWFFDFEYCQEEIKRHFKVSSLKGYGLEESRAAQISAGVILHYLTANQSQAKDHILTMQRIVDDRYVWIDRHSMKNLELLDPIHPTGSSLLEIMDRCSSPMGSRLMRKWVALPLVDLTEIKKRQDAVDYFVEHQDFSFYHERLRTIGDLERLVTRISLEKINPKEIRHLSSALRCIDDIKTTLKDTGQEFLVFKADLLHICETLQTYIEDRLVEEPAASLAKGQVFKPGVSQTLDDYEHIIKNSKQILLELQQSEAEKTGISTLKVGYNNVFGYYFEVTNKYKEQDLIPDHWVRKQTLKGSERYISDELKKLEEEILQAQEKIDQIKETLYEETVQHLKDYISPLLTNAQVLAEVDCLSAFAIIALDYNYTRPLLHQGLTLKITAGRHPVIENLLPLGEAYIPNDVYLDSEDQQIILLTGPNMSGKSAVLRQTALITLMAQMGSFVPASFAELGIVDKVFTRVGASDNLSRGESTFMLEMNEAANILNNMSERSLLLLDEIGRGTSTFDGISIAWAIAEYLHDNGQIKPKTLFATHYHELNQLSESYPRIRNFHIQIREEEGQIIFMRKLLPGGSEHSFGIHVARMAGVPPWIVGRAESILADLESKRSVLDETSREVPLPRQDIQLQIFDSGDPTAEALKKDLSDLDLDAMSPIEALLKLQEFQKKIH